MNLPGMNLTDKTVGGSRTQVAKFLTEFACLPWEQSVRAYLSAELTSLQDSLTRGKNVHAGGYDASGRLRHDMEIEEGQFF